MTSLVCSVCGGSYPMPSKPGYRPGKCPDCQRTYERERSRRRRREKGTTSQRGYGTAHQRRRKALIQAQPWCSQCGATEDLTADHVVLLSHGGDPNGPLQVLCRSCNSKRRAMQRQAPRPRFSRQKLKGGGFSEREA
jgi:5-methylcytosine-specific restriction enzyme A